MCASMCVCVCVHPCVCVCMCASMCVCACLCSKLRTSIVTYVIIFMYVVNVLYYNTILRFLLAYAVFNDFVHYKSCNVNLVQSNSFISVLQKSVFEGIAQEALSECVKSLQSASSAIEHKKVQVIHIQYKCIAYWFCSHIVSVYALSSLCIGLKSKSPTQLPQNTLHHTPCTCTSVCTYFCTLVIEIVL